jgi:hypothetical protein
VELVVALTILGITGSLAMRTLELAAREIDSATLGVRAVLLLSELHDAVRDGRPVEERAAGPGVLHGEADEAELRVFFDPFAEGGGAAGGFLEKRSWKIAFHP